MEVLEGYVDHIIFRNEDNGYTVFMLVNGQEETTCVGNLVSVSQGEYIEAQGQFISHSTYGEQFKIQSFTVREPEDAMAVERYLGSGAIKGVGTALAARIVRRFQGDTFRIIEEEPERLAEVKGISLRMARQIADQVYEKRDMRKAMLFLQKFGITSALSVKIYQQYGTEVYKVMRENPYRLADDIRGVGFHIADEIARQAGIEKDSEYRIKCAILYVLMQAMGEGHVYLPEPVLQKRTEDLLELGSLELENWLMDLALERKIVIKQEEEARSIYSSPAYYLEMNTARMICDLNISGQVDEAVIHEKLGRIEKESGTILDEMQRKAVCEAVRCGLLVITGGPGTGKTTTINTLISYFQSENLEILLAAPTGRAAKRMTEATGYEAKTIHRLLEVSAVTEESGRFERNAANPLEADVIIIDEMSMVDLYLMHALLDAVTPGTRLIMVGDVDQLPSVGPGSVLRDIIRSECVPVVRLTRIFRQASQSDIIVNAHKINRGEPVALDNQSRDFFFLKRQDANVIISILIQLVRDKLPGYVGAKPFEIQVLTPMRKGLVGVERLNRILQQYLNPPAADKKEYEHGSVLYREGDKVMQIRNNYQAAWEIRGSYGIPVETGQGIYNGDMGIIREINPAAALLTVEFDEGRMVDYPFHALDDLEHAFAVTIHKSQGSEYPAVVIPVMPGPRMLMTRNLIYTAVTRARKCVALVGDADTFIRMTENTLEQRRYTALQERIREAGQ